MSITITPINKDHLLHEQQHSPYSRLRSKLSSTGFQLTHESSYISETIFLSWRLVQLYTSVYFQGIENQIFAFRIRVSQILFRIPTRVMFWFRVSFNSIGPSILFFSFFLGSTHLIQTKLGGETVKDTYYTVAMPHQHELHNRTNGRL